MFTSNQKITVLVVVIIIVAFVAISYLSNGKYDKISELFKSKKNPVVNQPVNIASTAKTYFYTESGKYYAKFTGGGYDTRVVEVTQDFYEKAISKSPSGNFNGHVPTESSDIIG